MWTQKTLLNRRTWLRPWIPLSFVLLNALFSSCALYDPTGAGVSYVKECAVPTDQTGTLVGQWSTKPIPLAFHSSDFSASEISSMTTAANSWNAFFTYSKGFNTLSVSSTPSNATDTAPQNNFCSSFILQAGKFIGNVVIYRVSPWPSIYNPAAIALTSFCTTAGTPYRKMYTAVIEINYEYYFISGAKRPDLESVFLHELGHLHGLGHSCEVATKAGVPNCTDTSLNPNYSAAVMFPSFSFDSSGVGESKKALQTNDEYRANCLY